MVLKTKGLAKYTTEELKANLTVAKELAKWEAKTFPDIKACVLARYAQRIEEELKVRGKG